jgi:hypothetical protein
VEQKFVFAYIFAYIFAPLFLKVEKVEKVEKLEKKLKQKFKYFYINTKNIK